MGVNKVVYGDETLVDMTGATVTPATLATGVTAFNAAGEMIEGTMKNVQSDWSQNDATADDYVKNRTHWVGPEVLLEETEAEPFTNPTFGEAWVIRKAPELKAGETYTIVYNGASYECVCQAAPEGLISDENAVVMGNFSVIGEENTGEPFAILISPAYQEVDIIDLSGAASVKVGIIGKIIIHQLNPRYIPDMYHTESGEVILPKTTIEADSNDEFNVQGTEPLNVVPYRTYTVIWNGVEYQTTCVVATQDGVTMKALGDVYTASEGAFGTVATGEPFVIVIAPGEGVLEDGVVAQVIPLDGATKPTVSILGDETIHKLDNKYLDLDWLPVGVLTQIAAEKTVTTNVTPSETEGGFPDLTYNELTDGQELVVYWDGVPYTTKVIKKYTTTNSIDCFAGNLCLFTGSIALNTGEPFCLWMFDEKTVVMFNDEDGESHVASVWNKTPNKLPEEYLPESVVETTEYVMEQLEAKQDAITGTAGQFVVIGDDGKVTTKTIPSAEEATF